MADNAKYTGQKRLPLDLNHGTLGIVFVNENTIWFAMDTKVTNSDKAHSVLKIENMNNIFYSFAGLPKPEWNSKPLYNAYDIMQISIEKAKDFFKSFDLFDKEISFHLTKFFHFLNKQEPKSFDIYFNVQIHVLEMIMVSFVDAKPFVKFSSYRLVGDDRNNSKIISDATKFNEGNPCVQFIGRAENVFNFLRNNTGFLSGFENIEEKLVCLISKERHEEVGLPVDIVVLSNDGHNWYRNLNIPNSICH
jgi:hypothetical protein